MKFKPKMNNDSDENSPWRTPLFICMSDDWAVFPTFSIFIFIVVSSWITLMILMIFSGTWFSLRAKLSQDFVIVLRSYRKLHGRLQKVWNILSLSWFFSCVSICGSFWSISAEISSDPHAFRFFILCIGTYFCELWWWCLCFICWLFLPLILARISSRRSHQMH